MILIGSVHNKNLVVRNSFSNLSGTSSFCRGSNTTSPFAATNVTINVFEASLTPTSLCSNTLFVRAKSTHFFQATPSPNSAHIFSRKWSRAFTVRPPLLSFDRTLLQAALIMAVLSMQGELARQKRASSALSATFGLLSASFSKRQRMIRDTKGVILLCGNSDSSCNIDSSSNISAAR